MPKNVDPDLLLQEVLDEVAAEDAEFEPTLAQGGRGCICGRTPDGSRISRIAYDCPLHGSGMDW